MKPWLAAVAALVAAGCLHGRAPNPNIIVVSLTSGPNNLDPRIGTDDTSQKIHELVFDYLMTLDDHLRIVPHLAERLDQPDPTTYVATLRRGVRFHDGHELTSADVVYTFRSFLDPSFVTPRRAPYRALESVDAQDRYTVVFRLKEPFPSFPSSLTMGIVPEGASAALRDRPVGTGPYRFVRYVVDDRVELEAFPEYFGGRPQNDGLSLRIVPDEVMRGLELRKGTMDVVVNDVSPDIAYQLGKRDSLSVVTAPGTDYQYIGLNLRDPALKDVRVRQALAYAINRQAIVDYLRRGWAVPAVGMLPPASWAFASDVFVFPYDPQRARALLDEAGFPDPDGDGPQARLRLTLKVSNVEFNRLQSTAIQQDLRRVGIDLDVRMYEFATLYADIIGGNFQMYTLQWTGGSLADPDILRQVFHSSQVPPAGFNRGHYNNPRVDALIDEASVSTDESRRRELFAEVQRILAMDVPYISLWYKTNFAIAQRTLEGVQLSPVGNLLFLKMSRAFALLRRISFALVLCAAAAPLRAAFLFDPALRFRIVTTEHFVIYFHQGEERPAARLASIAESVWQELRESFDVVPPRRTHVVLVDQTELANGMASPLPFDTIVVTASAPAGSEFIARTDDWLTLVFTHEFTHIVHLDRSIGWARVVRDVFGRVPLAMPNLFLPVWQVEGLAVYEESRLTGQGRLTAGDFRAIEREASRAGRPEPLDRVNGGLIDWPSGLAAYSSGLGFHAYLAEKYGADKQAELAAGSAGRVPFTQSPLFKRLYGRSLGALWREYEASTHDNLDATATNDEPTRLTRRGFEASGPRFAGPPCDGCPDEIVYAAADPHGFPSLYAVNRDGSDPHRLTTRYLGSTTGVSASALVFDEHELRRNVALHSDLFWLDRRTNHVEALTSGARLVDPDLAPDGRSIVCAREGSGQRELVVLRLDRGGGTLSSTPGGKRAVSEIVTLAAEPGTQFNAPRWSPDGRMVAAERHRLGSLPEIVVVDVATKSVRGVAALANARVVTPAWRPDGQAVIAAVQLDDRPFNLFEFPVDGSGDGRQLTHTSGGATWPDISPDGHTIVFVGYTIDGFDLFTVPYPPGSEGARLSAAPSNLIQAPSPTPEADLAQRAQAPYSPWPTLSPTYWTPVIESDSDQVRLGVATGGLDVLGYHGYSASATWLVSGPDTTTRPSSATPDWEATYAYSRWRPTLFLSASSQSSFFRGPSPSPNGGAGPIGTLREQQVEGGILVPFQHVRVGHRAFAAVLKSVDDYALPQRSTRIDRTSGRLGWSTNTAKVYGYSISPEHGVTVGTTAELVRRALGASGDATTYTADARAYLPGFFGHHVLALRTAGAASTGEAAVRKVFLLGGPDASAGVLDFGSGAFHLLRAFPSDAFAGTHVAVINADYRLPIATPQRGVGTWPLFVRTIHAAVFADAGHAWSKSFAVADAKTAGGAELAFDVVVGYRFPFTLTVGAAAGRDGQVHASSSAAYFRIGLAF